MNTTLDFLDASLPPNSTVILLALAKGTLLYDNTQHLLHPLGTPYPAFYEYNLRHTSIRTGVPVLAEICLRF